MKGLKLLPALALFLALPAQAQTASTAVHFVGTDGNWFNPANWSTGRVPDARTDVEISDGAQVVIDPARGSSEVSVHDITITKAASLTTLPGTILQTRNEYVSEGGRLFLRGSGSTGGSATYAMCGVAEPVCPIYLPGLDLAALSLNPSTQSKRDVYLKTSAQFGLGGTEPASVTRGADGSLQLHAGPGHHATLTGNTVVTEGVLRLSLHYGFEPRPGQTFQIITASERLSGQFLGLPEGAPVGCTDSGVGLYISYRNNAVTVSAKEASPVVCLLLPAIQKVRESQ